MDIRNNSLITLLLIIFYPILSNGQLETRVGETIVCNTNSHVGAMGQQAFSTSFNPTSKTSELVSRSNSFNSNFEVKFIGFPSAAQAAVQEAIDIWASILKSQVKIRIFANWSVIQDSPNTLAFVVPTEARNFGGNSFTDIWYPITLAEKLAGRDLNSLDEADIVATFNAGRSDWYFGTDKQTPIGQFDLVTIALHEIGHGLGFTGTFRVSNGLGFVGSSNGQPKVYDKFLFNGRDLSLLDASLYPNGSASLGSQLTGNSIIFKSEISKLFNVSGNYPRIYAPNPHNPGSSLSHLDETTYNNTPNSLMTPFASPSSAQHNPGPLVKGMFYEMGWLNTVLEHERFGDQESLLGKKFQLLIKSDTLIDLASIKLNYSYDNFANSAQILLNESALTTGLYEAEIENPVFESDIFYFFEVEDVIGRSYRYPINPTEYINFFFGVDNLPPSITHDKPNDIIVFELNLNISATVSDNIAIQSVILEYKINEGLADSIEMSKAGDTYMASVDLISLNLEQGDKINYRIISIDGSSNSNQSILPSSDYFTVSVKEFPIVDDFFSEFTTDKSEFFGDFSVRSPTGFSNGAIHSNHPYDKSETTEGLNKIYRLLYPIKIRGENSLLEFDEVVLVQPGVGNDYTADEFGDYVIIEGTNDNGLTWKPLLPGYNSNEFPEWLNYYNRNIVGGDSRSIGTLNFFKRNKIDLLQSFSEGDEVQLRFRLFSNSEKSGWGWAIDNLSIQDNITSVEDFTSLLVGVYPNPFNESLTIDNESGYNYCELISMDGRILMKTKLQLGLNNIETSSMNDGLYLLKFTNSSGEIIQKRVLKNNKL
jgi:hypothetical protein